MNWAAVNFDWNQVRGFLATVEEGSLSAGARALGLTQPTLGRQVAALEESLGVVLFERVGRNLSLTPSGRELLDHVRAMGEAAGRISLAASGQSQAVEGKVTISASDVLSAYFLPPIIAKLRRATPLIEIEVLATNQISDLQHREADIAMRHVRPEEPELIAKLVQEATAHFYATTEYLDRRGRPQSPEELDGHDFISFGEPERMIEYMQPFGLNLKRENFKLHCENGIVSWQMVRRGLGIATMEESVAMATPGIERVMTFLAPIKFPVWLTTHRELHTSRRIRVVFDALAEAFQGHSTASSNVRI
ncbi:Transcriptional regulator, LysR family [Candidatus Rhodobacter oscarellae]|uniref:Transcriptional regulator, LysR family n=1 Tax=Candidatus Rhodobacter oscarellae TaxID=1675527 RepID=A0A0J9EEU6_9RHOB|nr:LysR family transcriptional regulator [Candidatus Rhodobacter lobularis]KMW60209.1 Transcriptional regulator, LysR family [Candidatus Rhodobacter lobularis]